MTVYSVFTKAETDQDLPLVVREGFSWFAALLPPVFMLVHRLWLALGAYILALAALWFIARWLGPDASGLLYLLFALWLGYSASALRHHALRHRGYRHASDVIAAGEDLAQMQALNSGLLAK